MLYTILLISQHFLWPLSLPNHRGQHCQPWPSNNPEFALAPPVFIWLFSVQFFQLFFAVFPASRINKNFHLNIKINVHFCAFLCCVEGQKVLGTVVIVIIIVVDVVVATSVVVFIISICHLDCCQLAVAGQH